MREMFGDVDRILLQIKRDSSELSSVDTMTPREYGKFLSAAHHAIYKALTHEVTNDTSADEDNLMKNYSVLEQSFDQGNKESFEKTFKLLGRKELRAVLQLFRTP
jgi:hypothetical protein